MDSMSFLFLTDSERIEALYQFRISCSDPRCRNIFILHSRKTRIIGEMYELLEKNLKRREE